MGGTQSAGLQTQGFAFSTQYVDGCRLLKHFAEGTEKITVVVLYGSTRLHVHQVTVDFFYTQSFPSLNREA